MAIFGIDRKFQIIDKLNSSKLRNKILLHEIKFDYFRSYSHRFFNKKEANMMLKSVFGEKVDTIFPAKIASRVFFVVVATKIYIGKCDYLKESN